MLFFFSVSSRMPKTTFIVHKKWVLLWACFFSVGWLLPNHVAPWVSFHTDAWFAVASAIAAAPLLIRTKGPWAAPASGVLLGVVSCIPLLQWACGLIPVGGIAEMSLAYLVGFCLVVLCGARWEALAPDVVLDGLFAALGLAAVLSVWLQLMQWFEMDTGWEWWSMGGSGNRPSANFGQPNQAATFLCLGLGAVAWGAWRQQIRWGVGLLAAAYLLFGIALTGSRTAWLGLGLVVLSVWHWRHLWPDGRTPWRISALYGYLAACAGFLLWLAPKDSLLTAVSTKSAGIRQNIWHLCWEAICAAPWTGYGWNQTALAEVRALDMRSDGFIPFNAAHNLFIDVVVWCGIPLGGVLCIAIVVWLVKRFLVVKRPDQAVLMLLVLLVFNHAMLELPLHYAYLLLPVGWLIGALEARTAGNVDRWVKVPRAAVVALSLSATTLLALIIRDYFPIEEAYQNMQYERSRIQIAAWTVPDALVLSHFSRQVGLMRAATPKGLSEAELVEREQLIEALPDGHAIFYLAVAEALNQRPEQAVVWLRRYCKMSAVDGCVNAEKNWSHLGTSHPEIAAIPWPFPLVKGVQP